MFHGVASGGAGRLVPLLVYSTTNHEAEVREITNQDGKSTAKFGLMTRLPRLASAVGNQSSEVAINRKVVEIMLVEWQTPSSTPK